MKISEDIRELAAEEGKLVSLTAGGKSDD